MFTGIVETTGKIIRREQGKELTRLTVEAGTVAKNARIGDSVSINGCCLTIVEAKDTNLTFDLLHETESRTSFKNVTPGRLVNLEAAVPADGRLGGHFVTGHIDGVGIIRTFSISGAGLDYELAIEMEPEWGIWLVPKGCIAIDGISLTVGDVRKDSFTAWIIPHTREITALRDRSKGEMVNLEFDILAKYAEKILATHRGVR